MLLKQLFSSVTFVGDIRKLLSPPITKNKNSCSQAHLLGNIPFERCAFVAQ